MKRRSSLSKLNELSNLNVSGRRFCSLVSLCAVFLCLFFLAVLPVSAREEEYTYTIRFFSGRQGSFAEGEVMEYTGLHYGDRINFYQSAVTLNDNSKYYIRGIRESGKDNSESTQASSFVVTGDRDYVIAYGILGDATSYTINYVDTEGNTLAPSETYYGNVGDRPVVAYVYIEGWQPEAYNMTQTLKKDPAENVFNFVYTRTPEAVSPEPEPSPQPPAVEPPVDSGVVVIPAPVEEEPDADDGTVPDDNPVPDDDEDPDDGPGPDDTPDEQDIPDDDLPQGGPEEPEEMRDLDDMDIPTANFLMVAADARLLGIPVPVLIVLGAALVGAAWYFLILKKKKKKEEKS